MSIWVHHTWILWGFLDLGVCLLSQIEEVFSHYSWAFLSSPSGTPKVRMLFHSMLFQRSLKVPSLFKIIFSLYFSVTVSSIALYSSSLICSSNSSNQLMNPTSVVFFSSVITPFGTFFYHLYLFVEVLLCSSLLLPSSVSIFMTITFNFLSGRLLISISFHFLRLHLILSIGTYSFVS